MEEITTDMKDTEDGDSSILDPSKIYKNDGMDDIRNSNNNLPQQLQQQRVIQMKRNQEKGMKLIDKLVVKVKEKDTNITRSDDIEDIASNNTLRAPLSLSLKLNFQENNKQIQQSQQLIQKQQYQQQQQYVQQPMLSQKLFKSTGIPSSSTATTNTTTHTYCTSQQPQSQSSSQPSQSQQKRVVIIERKDPRQVRQVYFERNTQNKRSVKILEKDQTMDVQEQEGDTINIDDQAGNNSIHHANTTSCCKERDDSNVSQQSRQKDEDIDDDFEQINTSMNQEKQYQEKLDVQAEPQIEKGEDKQSPSLQSIHNDIHLRLKQLHRRHQREAQSKYHILHVYHALLGHSQNATEDGSSSSNNNTSNALCNDDQVTFCEKYSTFAEFWKHYKERLERGSSESLEREFKISRRRDHSRNETSERQDDKDQKRIIVFEKNNIKKDWKNNNNNERQRSRSRSQGEQQSYGQGQTNNRWHQQRQQYPYRQNNYQIDQRDRRDMYDNRNNDDRRQYYNKYDRNYRSNMHNQSQQYHSQNQQYEQYQQRRNYSNDNNSMHGQQVGLSSLRKSENEQNQS